MKIKDLVIGKKYLYNSYNPHDDVYMEIAYEYLGSTNGTPTLFIFRYLSVKTNLPAAGLLNFKGKLAEYDEEFLEHDLKMGWKDLPENYELIYA